MGKWGIWKTKEMEEEKMVIYRKNNGIEDSEWEIDGFEKPK